MKFIELTVATNQNKVLLNVEQIIAVLEPTYEDTDACKAVVTTTESIAMPNGNEWHVAEGYATVKNILTSARKTDERRLNFSERNAVAMAYEMWLLEENKAHEGEFQLKDNSLNVITYLARRGFLNNEAIRAALEKGIAE